MNNPKKTRWKGTVSTVPQIMLLLCALSAPGWCADLQGPDQVAAGQGLTLQTSGSGTAILYVSGPGTAIKREVKLGEEISLRPEELRNEGRYVASLGDASGVKIFFVTAAAPLNVTFLARPSRVPSALPDAISGVAFVYDSFKNLVSTPTQVKFSLSVNNSAGAESAVQSRAVQSKDGIAYIKDASPSHAGAAQFMASIGDTSVRRVVTLVAGEPCSLHISVHREGAFLVVDTDPIKDCAGNPVPDGTIVTFTETEAGTGWRSQVDARIKRGIARAQLPPSNNATISVASGIKMGNEIHVGGGA
jgi:hypothetical protein